MALPEAQVPREQHDRAAQLVQMGPQDPKGTKATMAGQASPDPTGSRATKDLRGPVATKVGPALAAAEAWRAKMGRADLGDRQGQRVVAAIGLLRMVLKVLRVRRVRQARRVARAATGFRATRVMLATQAPTVVLG